MSPSPAPLSLLEAISRASADAFSATVQWFGGLTQTQQLLLPTSLALVVLLWAKLCPPKAKAPAGAAEDEAIYTSAIERWSAAGEAEKKRRAASRA